METTGSIPGLQVKVAGIHKSPEWYPIFANYRGFLIIEVWIIKIEYCWNILLNSIQFSDKSSLHDSSSMTIGHKYLSMTGTIEFW